MGQAVGLVGKLSDDWECTAEVVREPVKKVFDISLVFKKEDIFMRKYMKIFKK